MRVLQPQPHLGNAAAIVSAGAGAASASIAAGGATAAALTAIGVSAQAIPVVGQVLGAVALVAGFIANARAKSKAAKASQKEVDKANIELIAANAEMDRNIATAQNEILKVNTELARLGLQGVQLNGIGTWLKKTFTPGKYQEGILADKVKENERLQKLYDDKIVVLEQTQSQLQTIYNKLTAGKNSQTILLWVGGTLLGGSILYGVAKYFKWI